MKIFTTHEIREAWAHAAAGGQALHLMTGEWAKGWGGPACFRRAAAAGEAFAHLFDQSPARLTFTAIQLGVRRVFIHHEGTDRQHVDLCGGPLRRAIRQAEAEDAEQAKSLFPLSGFSPKGP